MMRPEREPVATKEELKAESENAARSLPGYAVLGAVDQLAETWSREARGPLARREGRVIPQSASDRPKCEALRRPQVAAGSGTTHRAAAALHLTIEIPETRTGRARSSVGTVTSTVSSSSCRST